MGAEWRVPGWGVVRGCRSGESRGRGKRAHCCHLERTAESPPSTAPTWPPSCSSCSYWTPFCCAFECHPSSWWGADWPGKGKRLKLFYAPADLRESSLQQSLDAFLKNTVVNGWVTHIVQFKVEPTGVTHRLSVGVASPQGCCACVTVGTHCTCPLADNL